MTFEKAVKEFEDRLRKYKNGEDPLADVLALYALKLQIPKKTKGKCPTCNKDVIGSGFYCWNCGQRLDWRKS